MKKIFTTSKAPAAIGPYSQAVEINNTLYISGQIPLDPGTGKLIEGDISAQTDRVLRNIAAILEEAGYKLSDVVKTTCILSNISNFIGMI
jgi:2-iminobutanoate/2-iminopropanoate deaminase